MRMLRCTARTRTCARLSNSARSRTAPRWKCWANADEWRRSRSSPAGFAAGKGASLLRTWSKRDGPKVLLERADVELLSPRAAILMCHVPEAFGDRRRAQHVLLLQIRPELGDPLGTHVNAS